MSFLSHSAAYPARSNVAIPSHDQPMVCCLDWVVDGVNPGGSELVLKNMVDFVKAMPIQPVARLPWHENNSCVHYLTTYPTTTCARSALAEGAKYSDRKQFMFAGKLQVTLARVPIALRALAETKPSFSTTPVLTAAAQHGEIYAQMIARSTELQHCEKIQFAESMVPHFPIAGQPFSAFEPFFLAMRERYRTTMEQCNSLQKLLDLARLDDRARVEMERILDEAIPGGRYEASDVSDGYADASSPFQGSAVGSAGTSSADPSYSPAVGLLQHSFGADQSPDPLAIAPPARFPSSLGAQITSSPQYSVPRTCFPSTFSAPASRPSGTYWSSPPVIGFSGVYDSSSPPIAGPSITRVPFPLTPEVEEDVEWPASERNTPSHVGVSSSGSTRSLSTPVARPSRPALLSRDVSSSDSSDMGPLRAPAAFQDGRAMVYMPPNRGEFYGQQQRQITFSEPSPCVRHGRRKP